MPRLPRLEYANAIYHVITRGDGRRQLFHDLGHYDRITRGLKDEVSRSSWKVLAIGKRVHVTREAILSDGSGGCRANVVNFSET